jgi:hypothetical protein
MNVASLILDLARRVHRGEITPEQAAEILASADISQGAPTAGN